MNTKAKKNLMFDRFEEMDNSGKLTRFCAYRYAYMCMDEAFEGAYFSKAADLVFRLVMGQFSSAPDWRVFDYLIGAKRLKPVQDQVIMLIEQKKADSDCDLGIEFRISFVKRLLRMQYFRRAMEICQECLNILGDCEKIAALLDMVSRKAKQAGKHIDMQSLRVDPRWRKMSVSGFHDVVPIRWMSGFPSITGVVMGMQNTLEEDESEELRLLWSINPTYDLSVIDYEFTFKELWQLGIVTDVVYNNSEGMVVSIPTVQIGHVTIQNMAVRVVNTYIIPTLGQSVLNMFGDYEIDFATMRLSLC